MISPPDIRDAIKLIQSAPRPDATLRLFMAALTHVHMNSGELQVSRKRLGEDAFLQPAEVSRGLNALKRLNILRDEDRGRAKRWFINPRLAWAGSLTAREAAVAKTEAAAPALRLVPSP